MIKWKGSGNGETRDLFGFGLSFRNLDLLREGKPIKVSGKEIGLDFDIILHAGPTEATLVKELSRAGLLTDHVRTMVTFDGNEGGSNGKIPN